MFTKSMVVYSNCDYFSLNHFLVKVYLDLVNIQWAAGCSPMQLLFERVSFFKVTLPLQEDYMFSHHRDLQYGKTVAFFSGSGEND